MGQVIKKLYYNRSGTTYDCRLYQYLNDVTTGTTGYLALQSGGTPLYARLVGTTESNASHLRVNKGGTTYAIANNVYYPPGLTGLSKHEVHITSGTSSTNYANSYYLRIPNEFKSGTSTSTNTATDSYAYIAQHAGGGGNSYFVIYGWNSVGAVWTSLRAYSYSRTLLQGAGDRAEYQYFHASPFNQYTDFYIYVRAKQYSNTNVKIYLRNETLAVGDQIKVYSMNGITDPSYPPIMLAGKDTGASTKQCGRVITSVAQNGNYARVNFSSNILSERGSTEWYPFANVGNKITFSAHGAGSIPFLSVGGTWAPALKVQSIYYPPTGTETGGYMDLVGLNNEAVSVSSTGTSPMMVWNMTDGNRIIA